jgi:hypothetical protein
MVCVAETERQRSTRTKLSVLALTGLSFVIGGVFALGPVAWLGITMIALGFWPATLVPVLLLLGARRKLRAGASPFSAAPRRTADPPERDLEGELAQDTSVRVVTPCGFWSASY